MAIKIPDRIQRHDLSLKKAKPWILPDGTISEYLIELEKTFEDSLINDYKINGFKSNITLDLDRIAEKFYERTGLKYSARHLNEVMKRYISFDKDELAKNSGYETFREVLDTRRDELIQDEGYSNWSHFINQRKLERKITKARADLEKLLLEQEKLLL